MGIPYCLFHIVYPRLVVPFCLLPIGTFCIALKLEAEALENERASLRTVLREVRGEVREAETRLKRRDEILVHIRVYIFIEEATASAADLWDPRLGCMDAWIIVFAWCQIRDKFESHLVGL